MSAADELDDAIARLARNETSAGNLLVLAKAYAELASATDESKDEPADPHIEHPIHQTVAPEFADVGTSFWSQDGLRVGFRPGGHDGSRR